MRDFSSRVFLFLVVLSFVVGQVLSVRSVSSQGSPSLSDDFNDNSLDTAKWNPNSLFSGFIDLNVPISETGQRLEIGPLLSNVPDSHYRGIRSVNTYNFSGAYCYVELVQPPSSTTKADAMFTVGNDVNNYYRLYVEEGILYGLRKIGGGKTTLFSLPYDPVNHRFLRIRHEATGGVSLDTAPGSGETPGTWVQRYSEIWSSSISLTATTFELKGGTWQPESNAPGKVIFDNFRFGSNSGSPPTVNAISPNSGTINGGTLVSITGSRFTSGATVSLGGSFATNVTVLSSSYILATTSAHSAGTVNVVVTNPDGQSGTFANAYTYSSAPPPQTGLLADDFNDNLLDTAKWNPNSLFSGFIDLNIPISETGQRLEIGPLVSNTPDSHYRGIRSVNTYNFNGAYCYVELIQPPSSTTKADAMFTVGNDVNNYYRLYVSEGILYGLRKVGSVKTTLFSISYDSVNHRFLRIRHDAMTGNVTLDTAAGSGGVPGTWVQRYAEAWNSSISLAATIFEVKGGTWQPESNAPGKVIFDNFRAAVPGSGGGGLSLPPLAALRDPLNRTGGSGENPLSRNFNFRVPILGLPGRAGLDLNLSLAYNSLVWVNTGGAMSFNEDAGFPSPGFRLGFPVLQVRTDPEFFSKNSYLLLSPDGSRTEFRRVGTSALYESTDSSYALLDTSTMILRTADGTQLSFSSGLKCTEIKDRNGNYITINYDGLGRIDTIVDTLSRTIKFNYDTSQTLASITQNWTINGQSQQHTWASFIYSNITIQTNFPDLFVSGPQNGSSIRMLTQVTVNDGSRFNFEYTSWGQVWKIRNHASDGHLLNYRSYDLPQTNVPLQDCPRFTERRDWAENWNRSGAPGPTGLPAGPEQEVITHYDVPVSVSWTPPNGGLETGTLARVTNPDGTYSKIYFAGTESNSGWRRGLPAYVETYDASHDLKRQVVTTWTQDNTSTSTGYELNPRVTETNTYDPSGNRVRVVINYKSVTIGDGTTCKLPEDIFEYQANASTVLRRSHTTYKLTTPYLSRRIIGLPLEKSLYEVDPNTLTETPMSKLEFHYDESPIEGAADPVTIKHDNTNFGVNFLEGRANLTSVLRYDVENQTQFTTTTNTYNRAGSLISSNDALDHKVTFSYTDEFATNAEPTNANPLDAPRPFNTLAYPTRVTDADDYSTKSRYNYDFGAVTWRQTPLPNITDNTPGPVQTFTYDMIGRLIRTTTLTNNAFTRYIYGPNYVETFSSINSTLESANEGHKLTVFDGLGRIIANAGDHPNSTGGFSAQLTLYDRMGRVQKQSNPTETSISITGSPINPIQFAPLGDDAPAIGGFGWKYTEQTYDWKGRLLVTTNQDGTTTQASYNGCGCAGGEVVTLTDEGTIDPFDMVTPRKRQQKVYSDVLGRTIKTEILNWEGGDVIAATVNTYNARDQITMVRQFAGPAPADSSCPSGTCQKTEMTYDGHGRLKTRHAPEQQVDSNNLGSTDHVTWEYNADDTIQKITDPRGAVSSLTYNARHGITKIEYTVLPSVPTTGTSGVTSAASVIFEYDALGNRSKMKDGMGTVTYNYDESSRLTSEARHFTNLSGPSPDGDYTLSYAYNLANQVTKITDPYNVQVHYGYDPMGRLSGVTGTGFPTVSTFLSNIHYRAWGAPKSVAHKDNRTTESTYDARLRINTYKLLPASPTDDIKLHNQYDYFPDGRLKKLNDLDDHDPSIVGVTDTARWFSRIYTYDNRGRILKARGWNPGGFEFDFPFEQLYSYDAFNNLTSRSGHYYYQLNGGDDSGTYVDNRRRGWTYGADGQEIHSTGPGMFRDLVYNTAGEMTQVKETLTANGQFSTYLASYDGDGELAREVIQETNTTSYKIRSSVLGEVVTVLSSAGNKTGTTVHLDKRVTPTEMNSDGQGFMGFPTYNDPLHQSIAGDTKVVYDPLGNHIPWRPSPQGSPPPHSYPPSSASFGSLGSLFGNAQDSSCQLDGIPINCDLAMRVKSISSVDLVSRIGRGVGLELGLTLTKDFYYDGPELTEGLFWRFFQRPRDRNFTKDQINAFTNEIAQFLTDNPDCEAGINKILSELKNITGFDGGNIRDIIGRFNQDGILRVSGVPNGSSETGFGYGGIPAITLSEHANSPSAQINKRNTMVIMIGEMFHWAGMIGHLGPEYPNEFTLPDYFQGFTDHFPDMAVAVAANNLGYVMTIEQYRRTYPDTVKRDVERWGSDFAASTLAHAGVSNACLKQQNGLWPRFARP